MDLRLVSAVNQGTTTPGSPRRSSSRCGSSPHLAGLRNDRLPVFLEKLCTLTGFDKALPMNSGAEAVETSIKASRKWATT